ncbi:MAG TPA: hypothetical protein DCF89_08295 [Flavobacteriales bacterium]|nr:hypothetical protein [Crocinitomicaceae bacterium]HAE31100.1 hypothetical protein [Flavobacteriales bacterium]|tara:strand:- start:130 stop:495 length:366 start_codon:yes stop_codon:yes gene_type:complete
MKKTIMAVVLMATLGSISAQEVSESVKQVVDHKMAKWEKTLEFSDTQKEQVREVLTKYVTLIEKEQKSMAKDRTNAKEIDAAVAAYKENMKKEAEALLSDDQREKMNAALKASKKQIDVKE